MLISQERNSFVYFSADPEPEVQDCKFNVSGQEGSVNQSNISRETFLERIKNNQPIDCMWVINVTKGWKVCVSVYIIFHWCWWYWEYLNWPKIWINTLFRNLPLLYKAEQLTPWTRFVNLFSSKTYQGRLNSIFLVACFSHVSSDFCKAKRSLQ